MDVLGPGDLAAFLGEHKRDFLKLRFHAVAMRDFDGVAFDDMAVAADHFDELFGHGCSSFFGPV
jgi:hypothetical protein